MTADTSQYYILLLTPGNPRLSSTGTLSVIVEDENNRSVDREKMEAFSLYIGAFEPGLLGRCRSTRSR